MFDHDARLVARPTGAGSQARAVPGSGSYALGGVELDVRLEPGRLVWSVANPSVAPVALDAVAVEWTVPAGAGARCFSNGYQSWSPTGARVLGRDEDVSRHPQSIPFTRAIHHSDPGVLEPRALRSELVTAIDLGTGDGIRCIGFMGGSTHGGTIHFRPSPVAGHATVAVEAWLGGAQLAPGERRALHDVEMTTGDDAPALLDAWAARAGTRERARVHAPYQVGWCSWYFYFHGVSEDAFSRNLASSGDWPFDVFQLDDGFQHAIGDWLTTNERFPSGIEHVARAIAARDMTAGLWLAPFIAAPDSDVAAAHPEWFARELETDRPLMGMYHPEWGGVMWELDTTRDDVREHLSSTARSLREMGYRYLKLDFTFSAGVPGRYADSSMTPAERVRAGYDAVREGAGDDAFILACGCPLGAVIGVADAMRIGPDVGPWWQLPPNAQGLPGYEHAAPSTRNAWVSTLARSFMHRRLWLNDPDCVMLRTSETDLSPDAARAWAYAVGLSGGLALVSDDLTQLDARARSLLDEVLALGRAADEAAREGAAPRCEDLLDHAAPRVLHAAGRELEADPDAPEGPHAPQLRSRA